jgi:glycosylphosphatidylinositol transamidase
MAADSDTRTTSNTIKIDPLEEKLREQKRDKLLRRAIPLLLTVPYLLGLCWTALHPIISVVTGELKCRGSYIDENGLDVHRHQVQSYPLRRAAAVTSSNELDNNVDIGLCDAIYSGRLSIISYSSVDCLRHAATDNVTFDIARIMPSMGPMIDSAEAVVIVVGEKQQELECITDSEQQKKAWYDANDLNASMLHMIKRLGTDAPWLTKIVYIVSPVASATSSCQQTSLSTFVDKFITSYLGGSDSLSSSSSSEYVNPLPPEYSFPMIRSLLVISDSSKQQEKKKQSSTTEVQILPQGSAGALPNLDLVFATFYAFQTHPATGGGRYDQSHSIYYGNSEFRAHPFGTELQKRVKGVFTSLGRMLDLGTSSSASLQNYASDLAGWLGFVAAMVVGPVQPHSFALNRGIDSLTIEVRVPTKSIGIHPHYADLARCVEHLLRSISNLHERLHHSVAQYTMPSPSKFVSHGEYIYPAILVSLPMVVRAASLALRDIKSFQFWFVGITVGTVFLASCVNACTVFAAGRSFIGVLMIIVAWVVRRNLPHPNSSKYRKTDTTDDFDMATKVECRKSLRFVTCLLGIYLHVPLLLSNYPLGFPSSIFWTPLLAMLVLSDRLYSICSKNMVLKTLIVVVKILLLIAISPSTILPSDLSPRYTLVVYTPLQLLLTALWVL